MYKMINNENENNCFDGNGVTSGQDNCYPYLYIFWFAATKTTLDICKFGIKQKLVI